MKIESLLQYVVFEIYETIINKLCLTVFLLCRSQNFLDKKGLGQSKHISVHSLIGEHISWLHGHVVNVIWCRHLQNNVENYYVKHIITSIH